MLKVTPQHLRPGSAYAGNFGARYGDSLSLSAGHRTAENIARKNGFTVVDGWPMPLLGVDCYVMRISPGISIEAAVAQVSRDPRVAWSEPMQVYQAQGGMGASSTDPLPPDRTRGGQLAACRFAQGRDRSRSNRRDHRQQDRRSSPRPHWSLHRRRELPDDGCGPAGAARHRGCGDHRSDRG